MRNIIFLLLPLICSTSLVAQTNSDSTKRLYGTPIQWDNPRIVGAFRLVDKPQYIQKVKPKGIVHVNRSYFGLPIYPFRFEGVNQIANTVAGVLSIDGETPSILGARREGTAYYINKVRVLEGFMPDLIE